MRSRQKRVKSAGKGGNYIQSLPVEILVIIFTKVCTGDVLTLAAVKFIVQCSTMCKQFSLAIPLVPSLSITHPSVDELYDCCPNILKKFKQLYFLSLKHGSCNTKHFQWCATFEPHKYCIKGVEDCESAEEVIKLFRTNSKAQPYVYSIMALHHRLVISVREHKLLQRLIVGDFRNQGRLILNKEQLAELREIGTMFKPYGVAKYDNCGFKIALNFDY